MSVMSSPALRTLRRADYSLERAKEARVDFSSSANSDLAGHWEEIWFWPRSDGKLHVLAN